ncbi:MAG TPA: IclR family transcriptional regulator, partial [Paracoccus sp.]|nr:IclR family transcriptional regulator [Paracoccus sp. (in: a-proteobacteria)]
GVGAGTLAMLAALPDIEAEAVIDGNRAEMERSYPLLTPERLRALCAQTRETGVALNPGLVFEDSWGLGVALHGPDGWLVGAVSLAAVQSRMRKPRRDELARQLQAEARMIEKRLAGGAAQGRTGEGQTR